MNPSASARSQASETPNTHPLHAYHAFVQSHKLRDDARSETVYQVYQDLLRIRKWSHLRVCQRASRAYIAGTAAVAFDSVFGVDAARNGAEDGESGVDRTQAVVPVSACESLSAADLYELCNQCVHPESGEKLRCVTLAIVDDDSTTAYYRLLNAWEEIVDSRWKVKKVSTEEGDGTEERDEGETQRCSDGGWSSAEDSDA